MSTYLKKLEGKLLALLDEDKAFLKKLDDGHEPTADDMASQDKRSDEIERLAEEVKTLQRAEKARAVAGAVPSGGDPDETGTEPAAPALKRKRPLMRKENETFGRVLRCMYLGKGDHAKAAKIAEDGWGDEVAAEQIRSAESEGDFLKSATTFDADQGGTFVPPEVSADIIEPLQAKSVMRRIGVTTVSMSRGTLEIPKMNSGAAASWVGETQAVRAGKINSGMVKFVWKKLKATIPVSKELLRFGSAGVEGLIVRDTTTRLGNGEDQAYLRGAGTEFTPKGIRYLAPDANVMHSSGKTIANIDADMGKLRQIIEGANVTLDPATGRVIMNTKCRNYLRNLRGTLADSWAYPEIAGANPVFFDFPVGVTNNMPGNLTGSAFSEIFLVNAPDLIIAQASELEVEMAENVTYTDDQGNLVSAFDRDEVVLKVTLRVDFNARYPEALGIMDQVDFGN